MKSSFITVVTILLLCSPLIFSQEKTSPLSLLVKPGFSIPVGEDAEIYKLGGGGSITLDYLLMPYLSLGLHTGYDFLPVDTLPVFEPRSLSIAHLGLQVGTSIDPLDALTATAYVGGGWYYGVTNQDTEQNDTNPYLYGGAGISYRLLPGFSIGLEASYRNFLGLAQDLMLHLGGTVSLGGEKTGGMGIPSNRNLELLDIQLSRVFPVFYGYYDENPLGVAVIKNSGNKSIEKVKVFFHVKQYMDNPKLCFAAERLGPGEERQVPLHALFTDTVLGITEGTKVSANIIVESEIDGNRFANEYAETLSLYDRNAMTWDETAKAASFVTAKSPVVLRFSKNISGLIKENVSSALNQNIVLAIALFQALDVYGIRYEIDPSSAYEELSKNTMMVDYLQFPRQTLEFRAGDCDDLSILYSALLESVGLETAFITIPGHIYMAFSTGMTEQEARTFFNSQQDILTIDGTVWLPVEVTAIEQGFVRAWKLGAAQWRKNVEIGQTELVSIRNSWRTYSAVGYVGEEGMDIKVPTANELLPISLDEIDRFVETEIYKREQQIKSEISRTGGDLRYLNKLGVLYARYGMTEQAQIQFEKVLEQREYLPALVNMGMLAFLNGDYPQAKEYYKRAESIRANHATVLLGLARVQHELRNYEEASVSYTRLKDLAPNLASRYAYLDLEGGGGSGRASDAAGVRSTPVWEEE
ncbi:MAG: tetratricopeptide repeat protein [Spirochaetia bacterium]|nr:tetratricopeptide repeat protein [Spirochaetia bacterium]